MGRPRVSWRSVLLAACALLAGCATPGSLHVYALASPAAEVIADAGPDHAADTPSFLKPNETVLGLAYDPFTDHFFLRLAPGDHIRVVDRPARAIKRDYIVPGLPATGGGDLAIRPRDGHVFAAHPHNPELIEFNRWGDFIRTVALERLSSAPGGLAYDPTRNELLVLDGRAPRRVARYQPDGKFVADLTLDRDISLGSLAYDSTEEKLYAPLADGAGLGVFGRDGQLLTTLPLRGALFDVGPRSFLRMF